MTTVSVLVAVNVANAMANVSTTGNTNIGDYVYMIDSVGTDSGEGGHELTTTVTSGDTLVWHVVPISPTDTVSITGFDGHAIGTDAAAGQIINPVAYPQYNPTNSVWGGAVTSTTNGQSDQYSIKLLLSGTTHVSFDPYIISNPPQ